LRGWGRFEVSPLDQQGLPIGGRMLIELSGELRASLSEKLLLVGFIDAGDVRGNDWTLQGTRLKVDVGPGLRYRTPVGVIRADLGFQLNPVPGLLVNGAPETRHWRAHFSIGEAF
jgi:outer membrane translocation and assembly module TamA